MSEQEIKDLLKRIAESVEHIEESLSDLDEIKKLLLEIAKKEPKKPSVF